MNDAEAPSEELSFENTSLSILKVNTAHLIDYDVRVRCELTDFVGLVEPKVLQLFRIRVLPTIAPVSNAGDNLQYLEVGSKTNMNDATKQTFSGYYAGFNCSLGNCTSG